MHSSSGPRTLTPRCNHTIQRDSWWLPALLHIDGGIYITVEDSLFQHVQIWVEFKTRAGRHISADHHISVTQEGHVLLLFHVLPHGPYKFVSDKRYTGHFDTRRGDESEAFLRVGSHLGLGPVIRFGQLAQNELRQGLIRSLLDMFFWVTDSSNSKPYLSRKYWTYLSSSSGFFTHSAYR